MQYVTKFLTHIYHYHQDRIIDWAQWAKCPGFTKILRAYVKVRCPKISGDSNEKKLIKEPQ
jgi:hypothetical protein